MRSFLARTSLFCALCKAELGVNTRVVNAKKQQDIPAALILCRLVGDKTNRSPFHP